MKRIGKYVFAFCICVIPLVALGIIFPSYHEATHDATLVVIGFLVGVGAVDFGSLTKEEIK